jgi:hypothetical protein
MTALIKQKGMTTLLISTVLLFGISLIALFSTKSIVLEKKISANSYRAEQALFRADGALNYMASQLDSSNSNAQVIRAEQGLDATNATNFEKNLSGLAQLLNFLVIDNYEQIKIEAYSNDKSTTRIVNQLLSAVPIAGNGAGKAVQHPLISRLGQALSEKMFITNAYFNSTIWSGGKVLLGETSKTYIGLNNGETTELVLASGSGKNNGIDILELDYTLSKMDKDQFFENFLNENASFIKRLAKDNQLYFSAVDVQNSDTKNGLIWLGDGDADITLDNATIGELTKPVILIVDTTNHTFTTRGDISIAGLLYIRGDWEPTGEINVNGAVIVEGRIKASSDIDLTKTIINYQPSSLKPPNPLPNTTARVIGSWSDY